MNSVPTQRFHPVQLAILAVIIGFGGWAYWPSLLTVFEIWNSDPDYSHGYFVVPLALAFLWARRDTLPSVAPTLQLAGASLLVAAGLMRFAAARFYLPQIDAWSIPIWIAGCVWLGLGLPWLRWSLPSILFLWFATPMPDSINRLISQPLQKVAAQSGTALLHLFGQPAVVEGTTILLDDHVLDVVRACSGIRMFYGIAALAVAFIIFQKLDRWQAIVMIIAVAPVAIVANALRLATTGILMRFASSEMAEKFSHDFAGFAIVPVAVVMFAATQWIFERYRTRFAGQASHQVFSTLVKHTAVLVGIVIAAALWKNYQSAQAVETLLKTAERHEAEGNWTKAAYFLDRYTRARPDANDVRLRIIEDLEQAAGGKPTPRTLALYQQTWRNAPQQTELLMKAARSALELGEYTTALSLAKELAPHVEGKTRTPAPTFTREEATALHVRALATCYYLASKSGTDYTWWNATERLLEAKQANPDEHVYFPWLAEILRKHLSAADFAKYLTQTGAQMDPPPQPEALADALIEQMLQQHSDSPLAHLAFYRYGSTFWRNGATSDEDQALISRLDNSLNQALDLVRENATDEHAEIYRVAASRAAQKGEREAAIGSLQRAIELAPDDNRGYLSLAQLFREAGTLDGVQASIEILQEAEANPATDDVFVIAAMAADMATAASLATDEAAQQQGYRGAAEKLAKVERFRDQVRDRDQKDFLNVLIADVTAQIDAGQKGTAAAAQALYTSLSQVKTAATTNPLFVARSWLRLGGLRERLAEFDLAANAYMTAGQIDAAAPNWEERAARALLAGGSPTGALRVTENRIRAGSSDLATTLMYVRSLVAVELLKPKAEQDFREPKRLLNESFSKGLSRADVAPLVAQIFMAEGNADRAMEELTRADAGQETSVLYEAIAYVQAANGDRERAMAAVDRAAEISQDEFAANLLRAKVLERLGQRNEAITKLTALQKVASVGELANVALQLADAHWNNKNADAARKLIAEACQAHGDDTELWQRAAHYAWVEKDFEDLESIERKLKSLGNPYGVWYEGRRLVATSLNDLAPDLTRVDAIVEQLQRERKNWAAREVLSGDLSARRGNLSDAVEAYRAAWNQGYRSLEIADRMLAFLTQSGDLNATTAFVREIRDHLDTSSRLFDRSLPFLTQEQDRASALTIAQGWVEREPENASAHARYGRALAVLASGDTTQEQLAAAAAEFDKARELAPADLQVWWSAVTFVRQQNGTAAALELIDQFDPHGELDETERALLRIQLIGRLPTEPATKNQLGLAIRQLEGQLPTPLTEQNARINEYLARFYESKSALIASDRYRQAQKTGPSPQRLRLALMVTLLNTKQEPQVTEAQRLWQEYRDQKPTLDLAELRLGATMALAQQDGEACAQAADALRATRARSRPDQLLQARCLNEAEQYDQAAAIYSELARGAGTTLPDIVRLIEFVQDVPSDQQERYRASQAQALETLTQTPGQSANVLRLRLRNPDSEDTGPSAAAIKQIFEQSSRRDRIVRSGNQEQRRLLLGQHLAVMLRAGAVDVATDICREPPQWSDSEDAAYALCVALLSAQADATSKGTDFGPAEEYLLTELTAGTAEMPLVRLAADVFFLTGAYDSAAALFERVLEANHEPLATGNNFALTLCELPDRREEALEVVAQLRAAHPENKELVDSESTVLQTLGRNEDALASLEELRAEGNGTAASLLHEAVLQQAVGNSAAAEQRLRDAIAMGVGEQALSPRDKQALASLRDTFKL